MLWQTRREMLFFQEAYLQVYRLQNVGSGEIQNWTDIFRLSGFLCALKHVCIAKTNLWQWINPPKHREAGDRPTAVKASLCSVFFAS